ncbi:MAG TPA: sensor domain-containing diguanylate cyclase [Pyrinomonadaceae bacterium]|nr:sensor domain-containing diguanylate cyclase [Pyrinomonadaceae bacterium]
MKHVILLSGENEPPTPALLDALREAGVETTLLTLTAAAIAARVTNELTATSAPLIAVLYEITGAADVSEVLAAATHAAAAWTGTPLVACRCTETARAGSNNSGGGARALDGAALMRLGFNAVADEPAQLLALLRELEARGSTSDLRLPEDTLETAPASLLLPEKLNVQRLRAAFEVVASLHFAGDQKSAASTALAGLAALVEADRWTIYLTGEVRSDLQELIFEPLAVRGLTASERELPPDDWRRTLVGDAFALSGAESRAARSAVANAETCRRREGARRILAVPLVNGERVVGVLEAVRESEQVRAFRASEATLLSALAVPLTASLVNSARIAEAERLSQTDDLTKLHNARFLRQYLISEIKRARRYGSNVTALFLDLDDFKQINDHYGHLVGSHVLMEMAAVILSCVRDTDVVTRYGGDEFVVILPETSLEPAARVAERLRERISEHVFTGGRKSLKLNLTASFGVANFPLHAQSPQQLIASADTAMYQAKAAHKNCICYAPDAATNP